MVEDNAKIDSPEVRRLFQQRNSQLGANDNVSEASQNSNLSKSKLYLRRLKTSNRMSEVGNKKHSDCFDDVNKNAANLPLR